MRLDHPEPHLVNPAARAELEAKFDVLSSRVFSANQLAEIKSAIFALESAPSIATLTSLCVPTAH